MLLAASCYLLLFGSCSTWFILLLAVSCYFYDMQFLRHAILSVILVQVVHEDIDVDVDVDTRKMELLKFAETLIHFRFGKFIALHS